LSKPSLQLAAKNRKCAACAFGHRLKMKMYWRKIQLEVKYNFSCLSQV